jgi:outer membrane protein assembly factor BamB
VVAGAFGSANGLSVTTRIAPATTMLVGDVLLRHTAPPDAVAIVERIDLRTLEPLATSAALPGGPVWPGGAGIAPDGAIHVVFGDHAHRLDADLRVTASRRLPRERPYNSFVTLADGHLVTKDFGGSTPARHLDPAEREPCELVVLDPVTLDIVDTLVLPEPSIARLSAAGDDIYVVGDTSLLRVRWDGSRLRLDGDFVAVYRTHIGQTFGWDCVLTDAHAWFLDDGDGGERFDGTLRGKGVSTAPLHLVRVALDDADDLSMVEVSGSPGGLVTNPPVIDVRRRIAVGYDSGNGVLAGFDLDTLDLRWRRDQDHASHLLLYEGSGELLTGDGSDAVVIDVSDGSELARVDTGLGMQSVLFPAPGAECAYVCTFVGIARIEPVRA